MAIDPVCGMTVEEKTATAMARAVYDVYCDPKDIPDPPIKIS